MSFEQRVLNVSTIYSTVSEYLNYRDRLFFDIALSKKCTIKYELDDTEQHPELTQRMNILLFDVSVYNFFCIYICICMYYLEKIYLLIL